MQPFVPAPDIRSEAKVERLPEEKASQRTEGEMVEDFDTVPRARITVGILSLVSWTALLLLLLWLFSLSAPFLLDALTLEGWRFWASLALGILPFASVAILALCVYVRFCQLPKFKQLKKTPSMTDARLRELLKSRYLAKFPDAAKYVRDNAFAQGGKAARARQVLESLKRLRGESDGSYSDSTGWLMEFKQFQAYQDELAKDIISRTCGQVGLLTAASPWKLGDRLVVAYHAGIMIVRLSRIYNRQIPGLAAFRLACRWIIDIYVAGELGELAAASMPSILSSFPLLGGILSKTAEGGVNAALVINLGRKAMDYFRPLKA